MKEPPTEAAYLAISQTAPATTAVMRNGKIVGGETIRPMLRLMPKADADALRARLETP